MRLRILFATITALAYGPQASASPNDEVKYIINHFLTDETLERARSSIALAYVSLYADLLNEKSIKVVDRERFSEMLPTSLTDSQLQLLRSRAEERCLEKFSADELSEVVQSIRQNPDGLHPPIEDLGNIRVTAEMAVIVCYMFKLSNLRVSLIRSDERPPTAYLIDVLEADGIVFFPNRIVRQTVISEFRKPNKNK